MTFRVSLAQLHANTQAALAPLFGFILLFFVWGMGTILNTGQVGYDKIRSQNAADAIALAHSEQAARDLNIMALNHVALSQLLVVQTVAFTLEDALNEFSERVRRAIRRTNDSRRRLCRGHPSWVSFCRAYHAFYLLRLRFDQTQGFLIRTRYQPRRGFRTAQRLSRAFERMNDYLVASFPQRSGEIIQRLVEENDIKTSMIYPPCTGSRSRQCRRGENEGSNLPVIRNAFASHRELCAGAEFGGSQNQRTAYRDRGFNGRGPFLAGGTAHPTLQRHVPLTTGISSLFPRFNNVDTREFFIVLINYEDSHRLPGRQSATDNTFTRDFARNWQSLCPGQRPLVGSTGLLLTPPQTYWLEGRPDNLLPFALNGLDTEKLKHLAIVAKDRGPRFNPENFGEREDPYHAYAQAMVYNPQAYDLYSPNWKARLVPSTHMDDPAQVAAAIRSQNGDGAFDAMADIILAGPSQREWEYVNAH